MSGFVAQALSTLRWLGPVAVAVTVVVAARQPHPADEVTRPASGAAAQAADSALSPWLEPGPLRGWQRVASGWLLRFQPEHGAWLLDVWVPDEGGSPTWRLDVAEWLPGARLSPEAASTWLGSAPAARERLGRRDWSGEGRALAGSLPAGGGLPRSGSAASGGLSAVLAGLLLAGATARRLERRPLDPVWLGLVGVASVGMVWLAPALSPLGGRLLGAEIRPAVAGLAWWAGLAMLMGGVLFTAITCPAARGIRHAHLLPWSFVLGLAIASAVPVAWVAELASLEAAIPALASLAVLGGWLAGLAGDGLGALAATLGPARAPLLLGAAVGVVLVGGPFSGPGLAVVAAAAGGREGGAWLGLAVIAGLVVGSLAAVCLWPAAQWGAWAALVGGLCATALAPRALAATRVQSGE